MIIIEFDNSKKYYVYVWYYVENGNIFYVGKGTKYRYRSRKRDNEELVNIINNCKCDSKIIKNGLTEEEAFNYEIEFIKKFKDEGHPLINILEGGHMPPSHKGKKRSDETIEKMKISLKNYHDNHPEVSKIQSLKMKDFLKTEKGKEFQEKSIMTRRTDEFRKKQSERSLKANNTPEYLKKQSEIAKKFWESEKYVEAHMGANNCNAVSVKQYDLNGIFLNQYCTMTEASKSTGVSVSKISAVCRGRRKTAGGFIWMCDQEKRNMAKTSRVYNVENDKMAKAILQYDKNGNFISEYRSISEATEKNNFPNRTNTSINLKGKTKSAYGYVWKYKQDNTVPSQFERS